MSINEQQIINAWESRVSDFTAHRKTDDINLVKNNLVKTFRSACFKINTDGLKVIDYGCGGGFLGEYLFKRGVAEYTGIDISKKSILAAMENLKKYRSKCSFLLTTPGDFLALQPLGADILYCLSVVQHFPDQEYFNLFFNNLNKSGIPMLSIQIKYAEKTAFQNEPYKTTFEIGNACFTNSGDVSKNLDNYFLYDKSGADVPGKYQYLLFLKKEKKND